MRAPQIWPWLAGPQATCAQRRFVYLRRAAALLEMALCNWALQAVAAAGFLPMTTPDLVRESVLEKCGFQPRADNTQARALAECVCCMRAVGVRCDHMSIVAIAPVIVIFCNCCY